MSRATLKPIVSKLREAIIKGVAGKLEKYGFDENGKLVVEKPLSEYDETIRDNLVALFEAKGINTQEKYVDYIHNTSRTFMHILICFKLMEKRGIMGSLLERVIGTDIYNEIIPDFVSVNPMAFDEFVSKCENDIVQLAIKDNQEEDAEYYQFIYLMKTLTSKMAQEVPLLFKDYEYNLIQPDYDSLRIILCNASLIENSEYEEDDFLGWIYQYWVDTSEKEVNEAKELKQVSYANLLFSLVVDSLKKEQSEYGEFYTPRWIVKKIINQSISLYRKNSDQPIETIKLLDPACGAGNFLVYSFDAFLEIYHLEHPQWNMEDKVNSILQNNIFGADIQREPLQITALNLWIKAKKCAITANLKKMNLLNVNILMANSLYPWECEEEYYQLTLFDSPDSITNKKYTSEDIGKLISNRNYETHNSAVRFFKHSFEIVVMNPPFVDARKMNDDTLNFLKEYYPNNARNLFSAFIQRALSLLCKKGVLGFISSDTFFSISSFSNIRELLLGKRITEVDILGNGVFDGPTVTASIMFIMNQSGKNNLISVYKNNNGKLEHLEELRQEKLKEISGFPFIFEVTDRFRNIFKNDTIGMQAEFEVRKGIVTAGNDRYLRYIWEIPDNMIGNQFILYNKEHDTYISDIKYVLDWRKDTRRLILSNSSARCAYLLDNYNENDGSYDFKSGVTYKLVGNFRSCILNKNAVFDVGTPAILMKDIHLQKYVLALMNSKLYVYLAHLLNPTVNNTPGDVRRLPFARPTEEENKQITILIDKILQNLEFWKGFEQSTDLFVQSELAFGLEKGADTLHSAYEIYRERGEKINSELGELQDKLNQKIYEIYGLLKKDIEYLEEQVFEYYNNSQVAIISETEAVVRYLREITKQEIRGLNKFFTSNDIISIIQRQVDINTNKIKGYKIIEEIEDICNTDLNNIVVCGLKSGGQKLEFAGNGTKDIKEPYLQSKIIAGKGKNCEKIFWYLTDFLIEFEDEKRYAMQNEIRRLTNEVYLPKLQRAKEKLQAEELSASDKKNLEKEVSLYEECVKTLENWKVVD